MHLVVMYNYKTSFAEDKFVMYIKGCATAVTFYLKVRRGNLIMCT